MLAFKTILHPTDFSERSALALRLAGALARDHGARLVILHVAVPPPAIMMEGVAVPAAEIDLKPLWAQLRKVKPADAVPVDYQLVEGDPAAEVMRIADEIGADVIVMGTHGRTGLGRLLMGSVAEQVVRKATCPVLTVKAPHAAPPAAQAMPAEDAEALAAVR
ncbi:MAG: universal stress protein [Planctomycetia bacterium]|nr:universal stress protein [Planctomycetia bacterium]